MTTSITKTIQIERPAGESYAFIAAPETMPRWAIHNVKAIRKLDGVRWEMETPRGKATLIPHYEERNGILDHEFIDAWRGRLARNRASRPRGTFRVGLHHNPPETGRHAGGGVRGRDAADG
jgi:hypothetical protein